MNRYISYGGGVNSTAMAILLLTDPRFAETRKDEIRIVMADTGNEYPETYAFVRDEFDPWLKRMGHRGIEWVRAEKTLEEYCLEKKIIPSRMKTWCSDKFKHRPIYEYLKAQGMLPTIQYLGIHYDEAGRVASSGMDVVENSFPLVDLKINQQGCLDIIAAAGMILPMKSGCFFCPNSKKGQIIQLERNHPDLFARAEKMEANNSAFAWHPSAKSKIGKLVRFLLFSPKYPIGEWIVKGRIRKDNAPPAPMAAGCATACFKGNMGAAIERELQVAALTASGEQKKEK